METKAKDLSSESIDFRGSNAVSRHFYIPELLLFILSMTCSPAILCADVIVASDLEVAILKQVQNEQGISTDKQAVVQKGEFPQRGFLDLTVLRSPSGNIKFCETMAAAITRTLLRTLTSNLRKEKLDATIVFERDFGDWRIIYRAQIREGRLIREQCFLWLPGMLPWRVEDGKSRGGMVSESEMRRGLHFLASKGITVESARFELFSARERKDAHTACEFVGLHKKAHVAEALSHEKCLIYLSVAKSTLAALKEGDRL